MSPENDIKHILVSYILYTSIARDKKLGLRGLPGDARGEASAAATGMILRHLIDRSTHKYTYIQINIFRQDNSNWTAGARYWAL